ncbi:MAG: CDGSH iron-sulfur domain-containing protein [Methylococcales bacterium]|nr:CDGSH iron-sulfur domain-containing protein [Methylococcales bacterium]
MEIRMVARTKMPQSVDLETGKTYAWCACGLSQSMPLCDSSHQKTDKRPVIFVAEETKTAYLCACSNSEVPPLCDGSHCTAEF